jgi:dolichol-phosphate mannosyltransferase
MDGDLQHDEQLLPRLLNALRDESVELVVGSRYVEGGEIGKGLSGNRARVSGFVTQLARIVCKVEIADPMSGFFMFRFNRYSPDPGVFEGRIAPLTGLGNGKSR